MSDRKMSAAASSASERREPINDLTVNEIEQYARDGRAKAEEARRHGLLVCKRCWRTWSMSVEAPECVGPPSSRDASQRCEPIREDVTPDDADLREIERHSIEHLLKEARTLFKRIRDADLDSPLAKYKPALNDIVEDMIGFDLWSNDL